MIRRYYGVGEELFEVMIATHPEARYTYATAFTAAARDVGLETPDHGVIPRM